MLSSSKGSKFQEPCTAPHAYVDMLKSEGLQTTVSSSTAQQVELGTTIGKPQSQESVVMSFHRGHRFVYTVTVPEF